MNNTRLTFHIHGTTIDIDTTRKIADAMIQEMKNPNTISTFNAGGDADGEICLAIRIRDISAIVVTELKQPREIDKK